MRCRQGRTIDIVGDGDLASPGFLRCAVEGSVRTSLDLLTGATVAQRAGDNDALILVYALACNAMVIRLYR